VLKSLGRRLRGTEAEGTGAPEQSTAEVEELSAAIDRNRASRTLDGDRELLKLRHRLGARLVRESRPEPDDNAAKFPSLDDSGLAVAERGKLDGRLIRGGIEEHGYVLVRGLVDREDALGLAARIESAFQARDDPDRGDGLYEEFVPEAPYPPVRGRSWVTIGGGLLAADSPPVFFEMAEIFERVGLRRVIAEFLDEPTTVSVEKSTLRRADPGPPGGWHQDGSFMGDTRALNVWLALSDCGVDAPGLEFVPRRLDDLLITGGEGSGAEHLDSPEEGEVSPKTVLVAPQDAERAAGEVGLKNPRFEPGDVMLFDDRFLHRTASDPGMSNPRYAIESWFFGASGFPRDYVPLAF
jgi:Phytanoyl-CoA dioxygenase (PhyH)